MLTKLEVELFQTNKKRTLVVFVLSCFTKITTKQQNNKTTKQQNNKTTKQQNHKTTKQQIPHSTNR